VPIVCRLQPASAFAAGTSRIFPYGIDKPDQAVSPWKESRNVTKDINVLALVKGNERYVFLFDDDNRGEALRTLGRYASNPELSFSWYDAAVLSQKIRQTADEASVFTDRFILPLSSENELDDAA
jgi:hypothetical protein